MSKEPHDPALQAEQIEAWKAREDIRDLIKGLGRNDKVTDCVTGLVVKLKKSSQFKLAGVPIIKNGKKY